MSGADATWSATQLCDVGDAHANHKTPDQGPWGTHFTFTSTAYVYTHDPIVLFIHFSTLILLIWSGHSFTYFMTLLLLETVQICDLIKSFLFKQKLKVFYKIWIMSSETVCQKGMTGPRSKGIMPFWQTVNMSA